MNISRQIKYLKSHKNFNEKKFKIFLNKKILIVGCGGIGSNLSNYLIRSGFSNLVLCDSDIIEENNLQRQFFLKNKLENLKLNH